MPLKEVSKVEKTGTPEEDNQLSSVEQIEAEIVTLTGTMIMDAPDVITEEAEEAEESNQKIAERIVFLNRLKSYAIERSKIRKDQVLVPTSQKGLRGLYTEMKTLLNEVEQDPELADIQADLSRNVNYLRELMSGSKGTNKHLHGQKKIAKPTSGYTRRNGIDHEWFSWDGIKLYKPLGGLEMVDISLNLLADKDVGNINLDAQLVKSNADNGDFMLMLRRVKTKDYKYAALTITSSQIMKAREQRLQLAYTGGEVTSLIKRDLGDQIDKRLKDPTKIIEKHKEDYLSEFSEAIIIRDIERIIMSQ